MKRPASVTTFGVLNIVFAALGVLGMIGSVVAMSLPGAGNNPVARLMSENPLYGAWIKVSMLLGLVASVVLLVAGIGLLRLKSWGRTLSIGYGVYAIIVGSISLIMNFVFLIRPMLQEAAQRQGPEAAAAMGGAIGGGIGGCIGLLYPILLLIFMTRPKVVAAFHAPSEPPVIP